MNGFTLSLCSGPFPSFAFRPIFILYFSTFFNRITLEIMTLQPKCEDVETAEGVAITVTGVAQVNHHTFLGMPAQTPLTHTFTLSPLHPSFFSGITPSSQQRWHFIQRAQVKQQMHTCISDQVRCTYRNCCLHDLPSYLGRIHLVKREAYIQTDSNTRVKKKKCSLPINLNGTT